MKTKHKIVVAVEPSYAGSEFLSEAAVKLYEKYSGTVVEFSMGCYQTQDIPRHCPHLVRVVEEMGPAAGRSKTCRPVIREIEGNVYRINCDDYCEWLETPDDVVEEPWITIP